MNPNGNGNTSGEGQPSPSFVETLQGLGWHAPQQPDPPTTAEELEADPTYQPDDGRSCIPVVTQLGPNGHVGQIAKPHKVTGSISVSFQRYMTGKLLRSIGR